MHFASDNWAGAHPKIADSLVRHATGFAAAYGASGIDRKVEQIFNAIFEREVSVFFVSTGTAANALAMAAVQRTGGVAFCHREAHMIEDECGAPEYLTGGARLGPVDGALGKMDPALLDAEIERLQRGGVHGGQPMAVSVTQSTEAGSVYGLDEIAGIGEVAKRHALPFHLDGARFANALVSLGATPAEMTWKQGVDLVSFGGTKNGCWCAEALVFFDKERALDFPYVRKRAAQLFSKSRFVAAQFEAYFEDGLWLETARHSNAMAARLAAIFEASPKTRLAWRPDANEVFPIMAKADADRLTAAGVVFYPWNVPHGGTCAVAPDETLCRFVTSFATTAEEVERLAELLG